MLQSAVLSAALSAVSPLFSRLEDEATAGPRNALQGRHPAAGRAHQPLGPCLGAVARQLPQLAAGERR